MFKINFFIFIIDESICVNEKIVEDVDKVETATECNIFYLNFFKIIFKIL